MRRLFGRLVWLLVIVLAGWALGYFLIQNQNQVQLYFGYWRTIELSLGQAILFSFSLGVVLASLLFFSAFFNKALEARRLRRENSALQQLLQRKQPEITNPRASAS